MPRVSPTRYHLFGLSLAAGLCLGGLAAFLDLEDWGWAAVAGAASVACVAACLYAGRILVASPGYQRPDPDQDTRVERWVRLFVQYVNLPLVVTVGLSLWSGGSLRRKAYVDCAVLAADLIVLSSIFLVLVHLRERRLAQSPEV